MEHREKRIHILDYNRNYCTTLEGSLSGRLQSIVTISHSMKDFNSYDASKVNVLVVDYFLAYNEIDENKPFATIKKLNEGMKLFIVNNNITTKTPVLYSNNTKIPIYGKTLPAMDKLIKEIDYRLNKDDIMNGL